MQTLRPAGNWPITNFPNSKLAIVTEPRHSAVADAADAVVAAAASMALRATLTAAIADSTEAERLAEALRTSTARAIETVGQIDSKTASAATACDVQVINIVEAANIQISPHQDSWTRNASTSDIHQGNELYTDRSGLATVAGGPAELADPSRVAENAAATHIILALHERLGSFIKR
jgi:hypothetical protein